MGQVEIMHLFQGPAAGTLSALLLSLVMAIGDVRTRRIPNYLTFGGALAGIAFQTALLGWGGTIQAILGLFLGVALLIVPYILGGMGAGDVKALAALGAWLGPNGVFSVFCYMGLAGGILSLGVLVWNGTLWSYLRKGWILLQSILLCQDKKIILETMIPDQNQTPGLPYGVAIALGMVAYVKWGNLL